MVNEFNETFIILDALDECKERQELLEVIEEIAGWKIGKLHVLTTSRRVKKWQKLLEVRDEIKVTLTDQADRVWFSTFLLSFKSWNKH
jgi:hypothetical protein